MLLFFSVKNVWFRCTLEVALWFASEPITVPWKVHSRTNKNCVYSLQSGVQKQMRKCRLGGYVSKWFLVILCSLLSSLFLQFKNQSTHWQELSGTWLCPIYVGFYLGKWDVPWEHQEGTRAELDAWSWQHLWLRLKFHKWGGVFTVLISWTEVNSHWKRKTLNNAFAVCLLPFPMKLLMEKLAVNICAVWCLHASGLEYWVPVEM